ncbi:MAG TPA: hypothetical protein VMW38_01255 [Terriglobia bacterium]|nr:hypothetical protein [Terriglobia bacterium]
MIAEEVARGSINAVVNIHRALGPGRLESAYQLPRADEAFLNRGSRSQSDRDQHSQNRHNQCTHLIS